MNENRGQDIHPSVDKRLLEELPRFFGGIGSAIGELFQNAHRAGATKVVVTYDPDQSLLWIEDDGRGIADFHELLRAGSTGWGDSVIEPAGVGFFAHLAHVTMSRVLSWRGGKETTLSLKPDVLKGKPGRLHEDPADPVSRHGTEILLFLTEKKSVEEMIEIVTAARALYPMEVTLNGETISPKVPFTPSLEVDTEVGTVRMGMNYGGRDTLAVWEHRIIGSDALKDAIEKAVEEHFCRKLARLAFRESILWIVDPRSGVRPKLPDRNELMTDESLERAARIIVGSVVLKLMEASRSIENTPDRLPPRAGCQEKDILDALQSRGVGRLTAEMCWTGLWTVPVGPYRRVRWTHPVFDSFWHEEDDGLNYDRRVTDYLAKNAPGVESPSVQMTLGILGRDTWLDRKKETPDATIHGLEIREECRDVAFCRRIDVEGVGEVPFIILEPEGLEKEGDPYTVRTEDGECEIDRTILFAGTPGGFMRELWGRRREAFTTALFLRRHLLGDGYDDWYDLDGGSATLREDRIIEDVMKSVEKAFGGGASTDLARLVGLREAIKGIGENIDDLEWKVRDLARGCRAVVLDEVQRLRKGIDTLRGARERLERMEKVLRKTLFGQERRDERRSTTGAETTESIPAAPPK